MTPSLLPEVQEKILKFTNLEGLKKLSSFVEFLDFERKNLSLISENSFQDVWTRHVLDSIQLNSYIKKIISTEESEEIVNKNNNKFCIIDLGSGNGFPIIPLALSLNENNIDYFLCEKSVKKSIYLENAIKKMQLKKAEVISFNLTEENILDFILKKNKTYKKIIFTSRAFKGIKETIDIIFSNGNLTASHSNKNITILFLKGEKLEEEVLQAKKAYNFNIKIEKSITGQGSVAMAEF